MVNEDLCLYSFHSEHEAQKYEYNAALATSIFPCYAKALIQDFQSHVGKAVQDLAQNLVKFGKLNFFLQLG